MKTMTNREIKNLVLTAVKNTINEQRAEWIEHDMDSALLTSVGWVIFEKRPLKKHFCFGYDCSDESYERACEMAKIAKNDPEYFISENLKCYDEMLENLESGDNYYVSSYYNYPDAPFIDIINARIEYKYTERGLKIKHGQFSKEDTEHLINFVKKLRAKQEKRCQTYLKKYGLNKIRTWIFDTMY